MWFRYLNLIIVSLVPLLFSCDRGQALVEQPNILWLVSEDNGPFLGCYGDTFATTPNLDRLASEGILYKNAIAAAPACAPSLSTLFTVMYPTHLVTTHLQHEVPVPE